MIWPFKRHQPRPSDEAIDFGQQSDRELHAVRHLKAEAEDVGASLRRRRELNHFGLGLEALIKEKPA